MYRIAIFKVGVESKSILLKKEFRSYSQAFNYARNDVYYDYKILEEE